LDAAIALGIDHGGWCPRGRLAEDGTIPSAYVLTETVSPQYHVRTESNVIDSDATLILYRAPMTGGTALTQRMAAKHQRACLALDLNQHVSPAVVQAWITDGQFETLNVAGPRESTEPGIGQTARALLLQVLG
jgi:hypothetical protein